MEKTLARDNASPWMHEQTWQQIEAYLEENDTVLLPVGATEQHGRHLPLFVDTGWAMHIAEAVGRRCGVLVAPPLHVAISQHHMGYPGTLTLQPETLIRLVEDIGDSLIGHGFRKILIVNGNRIANLPPLDIAAGNLRHRTGIYAAVVDVALIAKREVHAIFGEGLGHAGDCETSFMMHAYPDHVDLDMAVWPEGDKPSPPHGYTGLHVVIDAPFDRNSAFVWPTAEEYRKSTESRAGVGGDPRSATADKGRRAVEAIVGNFAEFIDREVRPIRVADRSEEVSR